MRYENDEASMSQQEREEFQRLWDLMEEIPVPQPSAGMQARFDTMLTGFKEELAPEPKAVRRQSISDLFTRFRASWSFNPGFQLAYSLLLVFIGVAAGYLVTRHEAAPGQQEIRELSAQVKDMRETMMLTLLENPSASERLRAVSYSSEMPVNKGGANQQVIEALLTTLNNDPNDNVRLMTLESLLRFAGQASVREGLVQSILRQESPLVQCALADAMVKLQEKRAIQPFRKLLLQKDLNAMVRSKIEETLPRI